MKNILLVLFFCSSLFAGLCEFSQDRVAKSYDLIMYSLQIGDFQSLDMNYFKFKYYADIGIIHCDNDTSSYILEKKEELYYKIEKAGLYNGE